MRFIVYIATSADGFIATPDGGVDWLTPFDAEDYGFSRFLESVSGLVMGRRTYEQVRAAETWPYTGKPTIVLTSQALDDLPPGVEPWRESLDSLVAHCRARTGDLWIVGGGETIAGFLARGAVDRIEQFVMPVLLGAGIPMLSPAATKTRLDLRTIRSLARGVVGLSYAVPAISASARSISAKA